MAKDKTPVNVETLIKTPLTEEEYAALKAFFEGKDLEIADSKATVLSLTNEINIANTDRDALKSDIKAKDKVIAEKETMIIDLVKEVNDLSQLKSDLVTEVQGKDKVITALNNEIAAFISEKDDAPVVPTVKVGKKTYIIAIPKFNYEGEERTAADVKADPVLAAKLVEEKAGVLVESV
ncbi:hypothetical protein [Runella sp.]|uniref:hypothetical protein n=1 Tax=Runella sp. TaxID=1960881 RepID=UPI003D0FEE9C